MKDRQGADEVPDLHLLFRPRSIAVIGVSPDFTKGGGVLWHRISAQGYLGKIYPISTRYTAINGIRCYHSVSDINEPVDLAIITVPATRVEGTLVECASKGIKFAVIHAAGFAELGGEGIELQERMLRIARSGGIRVVGPNCMGVLCSDVRLNSIAELQEAELPLGEIAFCGQSGWATSGFLIDGSARGLKFSTVVSSGNQADLDLVDYISFFGSDTKTRVICAYAEGFNRGRELVALTSKLGLIKPIIIWKSGFSQAGSRAVMSHTASIAGIRETWIGAAQSSGITIAEGLEELVDLAVAFSAPLFPKGRKVGIIVEAGGGGVAAADACEHFGLEVEPFRPELREQLRGLLKKYLPPFSGTGNPLDLVWLPRDAALTICVKCMKILAKQFDTIIFMIYKPLVMPESRPRYIEAMCQLRDELGLSIFVVPPHSSSGTAFMKEFTAAGLPAFPSFERAAKAIATTSRYRERVSYS
ncbi:CoA-binding protein [Chloroflexota bacterium]